MNFTFLTLYGLTLASPAILSSPLLEMGEIAHARDRILAMLETQMFKKYMLNLPKDLADQVDDYNTESFF